MKERCRDGCRTSLLIAGVVLVPAIFYTSLPPCHPYITIHFMEMIFSTCIYIYIEREGEREREKNRAQSMTRFARFARQLYYYRRLTRWLYSIPKADFP